MSYIFELLPTTTATKTRTATETRNATEARTGNGFADVLVGPAVDDAWALRNVAVDPRKNLVKEGRKFLPGGNLWYARAAFDRMLADQLHEAIDPDYRKSRARVERYAEEMGTQYWWAPGDALPERAPDFANAMEEGPDE